MTDYIDQPDNRQSAAFMKAATPPELRLSFLTTTREQLVDVSRKLAAGLNAALLDDATAPVMVAIDGTFKSGKSIVPDVVREELLGPQAAFNGERNRQESWIGEINGKPVEICFINAGSRDPAPFLQERTAGGITFVHNDLRHEAGATGMEIWLESPHSMRAQRAYKTPFSETFADMSMKEDNEWLRYIEIKVTDPRLVLSRDFQLALKTIAAEFPDAKTNLQKPAAASAGVALNTNANTAATATPSAPKAKPLIL
ncbi:MAG: hypothetical protein PW788_00700 [Micavibrio sp.]|nr:hypothetical protein [Micavibrio sp.]